MKATGIVRRIDDLGRVVVPKEIRRTLRIREGDPLEIFTDHEGEIILKKYSPIGELSQFASLYAKSLAETTGYLVCITDRDHIVSASGGKKKDFEGKAISSELEQLIEERESRIASKGQEDYISIGKEADTKKTEEDFYSQAIATIITQGDAIGSVIMYSKNEERKMNEIEQKLVQTAASFLGSQMEQ